MGVVRATNVTQRQAMSAAEEQAAAEAASADAFESLSPAQQAVARTLGDGLRAVKDGVSAATRFDGAWGQANAVLPTLCPIRQ